MNYKLNLNTFFEFERKNVLDKIKTFIGVVIQSKNKNPFWEINFKNTKLCKITSYENYTFTLISPQIIISNEYI